MPNQVKITAGPITALAELNDSPTSFAILSALPIEAKARTWGDEIYFPIPVAEELDDTAVEIVEVGDLGYWPKGKAFCIFFGLTPASVGSEIRPASAVNLVGRLLSDAKVFKQVSDGELVRIDNLP